MSGRPSEQGIWFSIVALSVLVLLPGGSILPPGGSALPSVGPHLIPTGSPASHPLSGPLHDLRVGSASFAARVGEPISLFVALPNGSSLAGQAVSWTWGDGTSSVVTGPAATRAFASPGLLLVYAQVTDPFGVAHDNGANLFALPVLATHVGDSSGTDPQLTGWVTANSTMGPGATAVIAPGESVDVAARLSEALHVPKVLYSAPTFTVPASLASASTFSSVVLDPGNTSSAQLTVSLSAPGGLYPLNFTFGATATVDNESVPLAGTFTFTVAVGPGLGGGLLGYSASAHPGSISAYEDSGYLNSLDPAIDYDSSGFEIIQNVYQTLIAPNGSSTGLDATSFVPGLATCVPGSSLCQSLYGTSLVSGDHYTFVLSHAPRFYDPSTGAGWPVYPTDVEFSVARTLGFANLPCFGCNNGWMLAQALLPSGTFLWDSGLHLVANNTPSNIFASMLINDSTYCPSGASSEDGCITFVANGMGVSWPFIRQLLANPLGSAVVPCGWFSAPAQGAGLPYWTEGNVTGAGDHPCDVPGSNGYGVAPASIPATGWDAWEVAGSAPPYVGNVQYAMVGSGPYWLSSVGSTLGYSLTSNPDYAISPTCDFAGCLDGVGRIGNITVNYETATAPGLSALENGTADLAPVQPGDGPRIAADSQRGVGTPVTRPTLTFNFQLLNLDYNSTLLTQLTGVTTTAPETLLTDLNLRQFLLHSFPYSTAQMTVFTENGTQWSFPYGGGAIPLYSSGAVPSNVSWPNGDPVANSSTAGSAGWWWSLTANDSEAGASCTAASPCSIPVGYYQNQTQVASELELWATSVASLSGGAVTLTLVPVDFFTLVVYGLYAGPGQNPWAIWSVGGWVDDYPDPSDPVSALIPPFGIYPFADSVPSGFLGLNQGCSASVSVWSTRTTPIPYTCQGAAYNVTVDLATQASTTAAGSTRDLLYAELQQIESRLGLFAAMGQFNSVRLVAPWIDPTTVSSNPWVGGSSQLWITLRDRAIPAVPLTLNSVSAVPSTLGVGQLLTLTATAGGGTGARTYAWSNLPAGCGGTTAVLTCRPTAGGNFSVHVTVTDQRGATASGSVEVQVYGLAILAFTATPSTIHVGSSTVLQVTLGASVTGAHFSYSNLPTGCASQDSATLTCTPTAAGTFSITVSVTAGSSAGTDSTGLTVLPPIPTIGGFLVHPGGIDLGDSVTLFVNGSSGSGPYNVSFSGVPGCVAVVPVATRVGPWSASFPCTPSATGTFSVNATLSDSSGETVSALSSLVVNALPSVSALTLLEPAVDVGTTLSLVATVAGGTAPFTISYSGLPAGCSSVNQTSLTCTPTAAGANTVTVRVDDGAGHRATGQQGVTVAPALGVAVFYADPSTVTTGGLTNITLRTSGGSNPLTIVYSGLPSSCPSANATVVVCLPTVAGSYTLGVRVVDRAGAVVNATTPLTVTSTGGSPGTGSTLLGLPFTTAVALFVVLAGVIAVVVAAVVMRRRPPPPSEETADEPAPPEVPVEQASAETDAGPPG